MIIGGRDRAAGHETRAPDDDWPSKQRVRSPLVGASFAIRALGSNRQRDEETTDAV